MYDTVWEGPTVGGTGMCAVPAGGDRCIHVTDWDEPTTEWDGLEIKPHLGGHWENTQPSVTDQLELSNARIPTISHVWGQVGVTLESVLGSLWGHLGVTVGSRWGHGGGQFGGI